MVLYILIGCLLQFTTAPDQYTCLVHYKGQTKSGELHVELVDSPLFSHTPDELKPHIDEREFLLASVGLSAIADKTLIILKCNFVTQAFYQSYQAIEEASPVQLNFNKGHKTLIEVLDTKVSVNDDGDVEYIVVGELEKDDQKMIKKCELKSIGLLWQSGFEDYEIYNIDLIKEQLSCLKKHS